MQPSQGLAEGPASMEADDDGRSEPLQQGAASAADALGFGGTGGDSPVMTLVDACHSLAEEAPASSAAAAAVAGLDGQQQDKEPGEERQQPEGELAGTPLTNGHRQELRPHGQHAQQEQQQEQQPQEQQQQQQSAHVEEAEEPAQAQQQQQEEPQVLQVQPAQQGDGQPSVPAGSEEQGRPTQQLHDNQAFGALAQDLILKLQQQFNSLNAPRGPEQGTPATHTTTTGEAAPSPSERAGAAQEQSAAQGHAELQARVAQLERELGESRRAAAAAQELADYSAAEAVLLRLKVGQLEAAPAGAAQQGQQGREDWEAEREQLQQLTSAAVAEAARLTSQLAEEREQRQQMAAVLPVLQMQVETAVQLCMEAARQSEDEAAAAHAAAAAVNTNAELAQQKASWSFRLAAQFWQRLSQLQPELAGLLDPQLVHLLRAAITEPGPEGGAADAPPAQPAWVAAAQGMAAPGAEPAVVAAAPGMAPAPASQDAVPTPGAGPPVPPALPPTQAALQAQLLAAVLGALPAAMQAPSLAASQAAPEAVPPGSFKGEIPTPVGGTLGLPGPGQVADVQFLHEASLA